MNIPIDIHSALKEHLSKKFPDKAVSEEVFNFFFASGVLDKTAVLRMLVKSRYYDLLKGNNSTRSAILDCSIEFSVSETFVKKVIYHYKKINP